MCFRGLVRLTHSIHLIYKDFKTILAICLISDSADFDHVIISKTLVNQNQQTYINSFIRMSYSL